MDMNKTNRADSQTERPFEPFEEVALLRCYMAITDQMAACVDDVIKCNDYLWGLWQLSQKVHFPGIGVALKALIDDMTESPEETTDILPAVRQMIEFALADAMKRRQEEESLLDEKYSAA
ncbi:MAG: hypothetical protein K6G15_00035 [Desulfovibrio sp.]|nr:hypothetical protein [Desulfovibrio sp.]